MKEAQLVAALGLLGQVPPVDQFSGPWAELTKFGLLAVVLGWVFWVHLPAKDKQQAEAADKKDKQLTDLLTAAAADREADRQSRRDMANTFQVAILSQAVSHKEEVAKERDRADARTERLAAVIEHQTDELKAAINESCQFRGNTPLPPDRRPV